MLFGAGCSGGKSDPKAEAPPPLKVERVEDRNLFQVDHPERFQLVQAVEHIATPQLQVTGTVNPDISRAVPVISLATGRVVEIDARLGDTVKKGQLLLKVQSADISGAFSDYQKAVADEKLAHTQLERAKFLYDKGAISQNDLQIAQDTEDKAKVDVANTAEKLRVLGSPTLDQPSGIVEIRAPISGVITDQQVTNAAGVAGLGFTQSIHDLRPELRLDFVRCVRKRSRQRAARRKGRYPPECLSRPGLHRRHQQYRSRSGPEYSHGQGANRNAQSGTDAPGHVCDAPPSTAEKKQKRAAVPATAILHLHDRDWVYVPVKGNQFRRTEVVGGDMLPGAMQEIVSGLAPGQQVVANALEFQNSAEQ